jgi:hypothetical protein
MPPRTAEYHMQHADYAQGGGGVWIIGGSASVSDDVYYASAGYIGANSALP